jgi:hypothetical protein
MGRGRPATEKSKKLLRGRKVTATSDNKAMKNRLRGGKGVKKAKPGRKSTKVIGGKSVESASVKARMVTVMEGTDDFLRPSYDDGETMLDVECGPNKALLYLDKLCQGSKGPCINFQGAWLTPNEFQYVSGRETAKDWKRSIRHQGKSIKLLLSKGALTVHSTVCECEGCRVSVPVVSQINHKVLLLLLLLSLLLLLLLLMLLLLLLLLMLMLIVLLSLLLHFQVLFSCSPSYGGIHSMQQCLHARSTDIILNSVHQLRIYGKQFCCCWLMLLVILILLLLL